MQYSEIRSDASVYGKWGTGKCQHLSSRIATKQPAVRNIFKLVVVIVREIQNIEAQLHGLKLRDPSACGNGAIQSEIERTVARYLLQTGRACMVVEHALCPCVLIPDPGLQQNSGQVRTVSGTDVEGAAGDIRNRQTVVTHTARDIVRERRFFEVEVGKNVDVVNRIIVQGDINALIDGVSASGADVVAIRIEEWNILVGIVEMIEAC